MNKIKKILKEIHLYSDKTEMMIKFAIWLISWIGGILVLQDVENKEALGSAYFIFALSLLMEFADKIKTKTEICSKFAHTLFCGASFVVLIMATALLFGLEPQISYYGILFGLTIFILVYIGLDCIILWLSNNEADVFIEGKKCGIEPIKEQTQLFKEKLLNGNLGNIGQGDVKNE